MAVPTAKRSVTDILVDLDYVEAETVERAVTEAQANSTTPEKWLVATGAITEEQLAQAIAKYFDLEYLKLREFQVDPNAARLVPPGAVARYHAMPVAFINDRTLLVAMSDPANVLAVDDLAVMTGYEIRPAVASWPDIESTVERLDRLGDAEFTGYSVGTTDVEAEPELTRIESKPSEPLYDLSDVAESVAANEDQSIIGIVQRIMSEAVDRGASDIHFEPHQHELRIRYRIDGVLQNAVSLPQNIIPALTSRIKILSELDIAERRMPQDGRVSLNLKGRHIDIRVGTLPTSFGESIVMRILDQSAVLIELEELGMLPQALARFTKAFSQSHGAVLVTGPTGAGKSTTLYGAIKILNCPDKNIITIEDPVEYQLDGITQVQVNTRAGLTFATGLRSMMRADPDIIMVGEIRDRETAQIAVEASLTGHLVLSTLHTNDAPTTITRLTEMGIEPFLVASAIDCIVAQRLARVLCETCKRKTAVSADLLRRSGFQVGSDIEAFEPVGCPRCSGTGYRGRTGLYEVMWVSDSVRELTLKRETADEIRRVAVHEGMMRLRDDGLEKIRQGITSIAEVSRVLGTR